MHRHHRRQHGRQDGVPALHRALPAFVPVRLLRIRQVRLPAPVPPGGSHSGRQRPGGLSSFGKEVHLLDTLLRQTRDCFFFVAMDEFARGTNPQEGAALARALVRYLGTLDCVALMTTHYDGVSDVAGAHYQVAGLVRDIQGDEGDDPRKRIARRMDYHLLPAPPGAPCPRDALRVCRLLKLDDALMDLFQADL